MKVTPYKQTVEVTHSAKFSTIVRGVGAENFAYQWRHNKINIAGETGDTLLINTVSRHHRGIYDCIVTNEYGEYSISNKAKLHLISM